jgi:hypothetical protein
MRYAKVRLSTLILGAAMVLSASGASAQSYGSEVQVLTIGAAAFRSLDSFVENIDSTGYLRYGGEEVHLAPLPLPEGALIEELCLYADDSDPDPSKFVRSHVVAIKQVPDGETPDLKVVGPDVFSENQGYQEICLNSTFTLEGKIDVDDDGAPDPVAYYVHLAVPGSQSSLGAGGVRILWRRQVSPPPSTPTFADVPSSDPGFGYIEALASSGITAGCSQTTYCPDANLTRRQMAVFLAKALGLHWVD